MRNPWLAIPLADYEGQMALPEIGQAQMLADAVESRFVAIDKSDITAAELRSRMAQITVHFVSQLISVTRRHSHRPNLSRAAPGPGAACAARG
jgi:hypothetical protein